MNHPDPNERETIGIRGKFDDEYIRIYEKLLRGEIKEPQAIAEMADVIRREPAGVNPDGSYFAEGAAGH